MVRIEAFVKAAEENDVNTLKRMHFEGGLELALGFGLGLRLGLGLG